MPLIVLHHIFCYRLLHNANQHNQSHFSLILFVYHPSVVALRYLYFFPTRRSSDLDDFAVYQDFLKVGETSFRKVFIGAGPHGESLVFGLRSEDKKLLDGLAGVEMYNGKMPAADPFYGEMRAEDGRLYVFNTLEDMQEVRKNGEAAFRLTQIGTGPQGQTVVFVLNDSNKKNYPTELVARFKEMNSL